MMLILMFVVVLFVSSIGAVTLRNGKRSGSAALVSQGYFMLIAAGVAILGLLTAVIN
jgi:choline-glycine betaine transporter